MRYDLDYVKELFIKDGCVLLEEEYKHIKHPMRYICKCGNQAKITLDGFNKGSRCKECGIKKQTKSRSLTFEDVRDTFKSYGCELLSTDYKNARTLLEYRCDCGNISEITLDNFKRGVRCNECRSGKIGDAHRLPYDYVKEQFELGGCKLLSTEYHNAKQLLSYRCSCGNISKVAYTHFSRGGRCKDCGFDKIRGENHPNYNPNITDDYRERRVPGYEKWRKFIIDKDGNKCLKCGKFEGIVLNVHHIINYSSNPNLAIDENNGATMCGECHTNFHKKYGYQNNNREQLQEWVGV